MASNKTGPAPLARNVWCNSLGNLPVAEQASLLNHSCDPNCEAQLREGHIWIVAARDIRPGEELTFDHGYDLEDYRDHPCHCGLPACVDYVVEGRFREHVRRQRQIVTL
jgi:hypothetical protein